MTEQDWERIDIDLSESAVSISSCQDANTITIYGLISSLYVCLVNIKLKYNFVETPRKSIIAELHYY